MAAACITMTMAGIIPGIATAIARIADRDTGVISVAVIVIGVTVTGIVGIVATGDLVTAAISPIAVMAAAGAATGAVVTEPIRFAP